jgi:6-phosphogluconolactonase
MHQDRSLILADPAELHRAVASELLNLIEETIAARGTCNLALAGGNTPRGAYDLLARDEFRRRVNWERVDLFWSDERSVPPDHPDSNYRMAVKAFVSQVNVRTEAIHRIQGEANPGTAASLYADELERCLGRRAPRFDLILLGIGSDGHTASLFPGTANLESEERLVVATLSPAPPRDRVSFSLRTINAARQVMFIVAGREKAAVLAQIFSSKKLGGDRRLPASLVRPSDGTVTWMLDRDAAAGLREPG